MQHSRPDTAHADVPPSSQDITSWNTDHRHHHQGLLCWHNSPRSPANAGTCQNQYEVSMATNAKRCETSNYSPHLETSNMTGSRTCCNQQGCTGKNGNTALPSSSSSESPPRTLSRLGGRRRLGYSSLLLLYLGIRTGTLQRAGNRGNSGYRHLNYM